MSPRRSYPRSPGLAAVAAGLLLAALLGAGCGDSGMWTGPVEGSIQGVWEGQLRLSAPRDSALQVSSLRLELVQRDFTFSGFLLRTDPLSGSFGQAAVDTLLVTGGSISTTYVSFQAVDPAGGSPATFEGQLSGGRMDGSVVGSGFSGLWDAKFLN